MRGNEKRNQARGYGRLMMMALAIAVTGCDGETGLSMAPNTLGSSGPVAAMRSPHVSPGSSFAPAMARGLMGPLIGQRAGASHLASMGGSANAEARGRGAAAPGSWMGSNWDLDTVPVAGSRASRGLPDGVTEVTPSGASDALAEMLGSAAGEPATPRPAPETAPPADEPPAMESGLVPPDTTSPQGQSTAPTGRGLIAVADNFSSLPLDGAKDARLEPAVSTPTDNIPRPTSQDA